MRIYSEEEVVPGGEIEISGGDAGHISRSLRAKIGERITICSRGCEYVCEITRITHDRVCVRAGDAAPIKSEPSVNVTLFVGYPKGDKLESVIQKSTELGVKTVVPFIAERSVARPKPAAAQERLKRWQKIAQEAAKQSGRGEVPSVSPLKDYGEVLGMGAAAACRLFCFEGGGKPLSQALGEGLRAGSDIAAFVGPEGGFSRPEVDAAVAQGFEIITLGRRILRCETAPLCLLSAIMFHYGEF